MTSSVRSLARSTVHHSGLSAEHYQEALDRFALSLSLRAKNTQRNYNTGAKSFLAFLEERWGAPDLEALTREHAETWLTYLVMDRGYGKSSVHGMAIAAKVFCKRLVDSDVLDGDPFSKVEIPQPAMPPIQILKAEDVQAMVDAAKREKTLWGKRDVAIMLLLYSAGFRQQELLNIAEQDIDWRRGTVSVLGKGSKPREVAPGAVAMSALDHFLAARAKYLRSLRSHRRELLGAKDAPIWVSRKGGFWGKGGLGSMLKDRAAQAGVTRPVHPHAWRHSSATMLADAGMSEMELRDRFGWSPNSNMPYRYTRATLRERTIERSQRLAPGNSIKI